MSDYDYRVSCNAECNAATFEDLKFLLRRQAIINLVVHILSHKINDKFSYVLEDETVKKAVAVANKMMTAIEEVERNAYLVPRETKD